MHDDLDMTVGDPLGDLRTTVSCFDTASLRRMEKAFEDGAVITRKYHDEHGRGCLLYWLTDRAVTSKPQLLAYDFGVVPEGLPAARRVVRYWDWGTLTPAAVRAEIASALAVREEAAAAEDKAVQRSRRTGCQPAVSMS